MKLKTVFQDEAFKLGEVADVDIATMPDGRIKAQAVARSGGVHTFFYDDLKTFANDWEDYEDEYLYVISAEISCGYECVLKDDYATLCDTAIELGIGFKTEKEAKKAVEKLKAWKRVKDGGVTFKNWAANQTGTIDCFATWGDNIPPSRKNPTLLDDLDLLFGGEK